MNMKHTFRKVVSTLCALALTATLIPAATAAEHVFLEQDFTKATVGDFKPQAKDMGFNMITAAGSPAAEIRDEGGNKFLSIVTQRPYIRMGSPTGKYTLNVDVRREAAKSGLLEIWVGNTAAKGTVRLRVHDNGAFGLLTSGDSKNYFVQEGGEYSKGVYNANRADSANVRLDDDQWYTITAVVDPQADTVTMSAAYQGKDTFCQSVIPVEGLDVLEYVQLDGQGFDGEEIAVSIDNIKITTEQAGAVAGDVSQMIFENYENRTAGDRVGGDTNFKINELPAGAQCVREVRVSGGNKYMIMATYNTSESTGVARNRMSTNESFSGAFTVEWDYNNISSGRGQHFETYLRNGGNIRLRISENGIARIRVLDAVKVPGIMEDDVSDVALKTNNWYTFKATMTDSEITVDIYDKAAGALVDTLRIAQSTATASNLLAPYPVWFDLWGKQNVSDLTPAAVALDNVRVTMGTYEGSKNMEITTPAAMAISDGETMEAAKIKCASGLEDCPADAMRDVGMFAWYHKAVDYALTNKLMSGFNFYTFGPYTTLTRAQVVQILYNKEGQPAISGKHGFSDVPATQWYNNAVTWGTQKGVMSGYGGGKFGPEDTVTVEQVAVILWNYAGNPAITGDADALGPHSSWAGNALGWAQATGVLDNVPFDLVTDGANRAQTAQMLMNYLTK